MCPWARSFLSNAHVPLVRCACFVSPLRPIITFAPKNLFAMDCLREKTFSYERAAK